MRPGTQLHSAVVPRGRSARSAALGVTVRRISPTHSSSRSAGALRRRLAVGGLVVLSLVLITLSFRSGEDGPLSGVQSAGSAEKVIKAQAEKCAAEGKPVLTVQSYPDQPTSILAVRSKRADAFFSSQAPLTYFVQQSNGELELAAVGKSNGFNDLFQGAVVPKGSELGGVLKDAIKVLVDTGNLVNADRNSTTGFEALWVTGPFKLQGEYMRTTTTRTGTYADFTGKGGYVSALWNITGETWGYKAGVPTTPLPNEPGSGMWQVGLRYDTIDLNDGSLNTSGPTPVVTGVLGGKMDTWTLGVNWYLRSNFKLAANYVKVDSSKYSSTAKRIVDDKPNIVEFRAQFYW